jgi:hypothetical protein
MEGRGTPAPMPTRRPAAKLEEMLCQSEQGPVRFQIAAKNLLDHGAFGRLDRHTSRITRLIWRQAIPVGRKGPGQEHTGLQCPLAPAAHAFGQQGAFIFGHGSPDVQEPLGLRILAQRLIEALDAAPCLRECFQEHHLMDIMARQTVWTGHQHPVDRALFAPVPQAVESWSAARGTTRPSITEDILWTSGLALCMHVCRETCALLVNGLGQRLPFGRDPAIDRGTHGSPPSVVCEMARARRTVLKVSSSAVGIGTPDPIAVPRPPWAGMAAVSASSVSWLPSR